MRFQNAVATQKSAILNRSKRDRSIQNFRKSFAIESLERRLVMASDFEFDATNYPNGLDMKLLQENSIIILRDINQGISLFTQPLADNSGTISIKGSGFSDSLVVDSSASSLVLRFLGGGGEDSLSGPAQTTGTVTNNWQITGENTGRLNSNIAFSQVENLTGAIETIDAFYIRDGGSIGGVITGNAGETDRITVEVTASLLPDISDQEERRSVEFSEDKTEVDGETIITFSTLVDERTIAVYKDIAFTDNLVINVPDASDAQNQILPTQAALTSEMIGWMRLASTSLTPTFSPIDFTIPANKQNQLSVHFGAGNDTLKVGKGVPLRSLNMSVHGGGGVDELVAPDLEGQEDQANLFYIYGTNEGSFDGLNRFAEFENVTGNADFQDTFVFEPNGILTGLLQGQSTAQLADRLVVQVALQAFAQSLAIESGSAINSGVVKRSENAVTTFAGVSDVQNVRILGSDLDDQIDIAGNATLSGLVVNGSNMATQFGQVTLFAPAGGLRISPSRGNDTVTIHSSAVIGQNPSPGPITIGDDVGNADRLILAVDLTTQKESISIDMDTVDTEKGVGTVTVNGVEIAFEGIEDPENLVITTTDRDEFVSFGGRESFDVGLSTYEFIDLDGDSIDEYVLTNSVNFTGLSGSLTIDTAGGDDQLSLIDLQLTTPTTVRGGSGNLDNVSFEGLNYGLALGTLYLDSSFESSGVAKHATGWGNATIDTVVFTGTAVADQFVVSRPNPTTLQINDSVLFPIPTKSFQIFGGGGDDSVRANQLGEFTPRFYVDGQAGIDALEVIGGEYTILGYAVETVDMIDGALQETLQVVVEPSTVEIFRPTPSTLHIGGKLITEPSQKLQIIGQPTEVRLGTLRQNINFHRRPGEARLDFGYDVDVIGFYDESLDPSYGGISNKTTETAIGINTDLYLHGNNLSLYGTSIDVAPGVTISTRNEYVNEQNPGSDSGQITFEVSAQNLPDKLTFVETSITLGQNVQLLADATDSVHQSGAIVLTSRMYTKPEIPVFVQRSVSGSSIVLDGATLQGGDIFIKSESLSDTFFGASLSGEDVPIGEEIGMTILESLIQNTGLIFFSYSMSRANSTIDLEPGTRIHGQNVTVQSTAAAFARSVSTNEFLAFSYAQVKPEAYVNVKDNVRINASGDVAIGTSVLSQVESAAANANLGGTSDAKANITLAVGKADAFAKTILAPTSIIVAAGDVDITSILNKTQSVETAGGGFDDGTTAIGLTISLFDSDIESKVSGKIVSQGDVAINSNIVTTDNITIASAGVGVAKSAVDANDSRKDYQNQAANVLKMPSTFLLGKLGLLNKGFTAQKKFAISGAAAIADHDNTATASVAPNAQIFAAGNVSVISLNSDKPEISAESKTGINVSKAKKKDPKKQVKVEYGLSVAVTIGLYHEDAYAFIGSGAQVIASKSIVVSGKTFQPYEITYLQLNDLSGLTDKASSSLGIQQGFFSSWTKVSGKGATKNGGGAIGYFEIQNDAQAYVDSGALLNEHAFSGVSDVDVDTNTITLDAEYFEEDNEVVYSAGPGGTIPGLVDGSRYRVHVIPGNPSKIQLKNLNGDAVDLTNATGAGRLRLAIAKDEQDVVIFAKAESQTANLAGTIPNMNPKKIYDREELSGGESGVGGSLIITNFKNVVIAEIRSDARVHSDTLTVRADTDFLDVSFSFATGSGTSTGFAGTGSIIIADNETTARIADGALVTTGSGYIKLPRDIRPIFGNQNDGLIQDVAGIFKASYGDLANFNQDEVDFERDLIWVAPEVEFENGQQVLYKADGDALGGLTNSATYYVIVDPAIEINESNFNPQTKAYNLGSGHDFVSGDMFYMDSGETEDRLTVFAIVDPNAHSQVLFADTVEDSLAGNASQTVFATGTLIPKRGVRLAASKADAENYNAINLVAAALPPVPPRAIGGIRIPQEESGSDHLRKPDYLNDANVEFYPLALDSDGNRKVDADDATVVSVSEGAFTINQSLLVIAQDNSVFANGLGAFSSATDGGAGYGFTVGVNVINRDTQALIGSTDGVTSSKKATVQSAGNVTVSAKSLGIGVVSSIASAVSDVDQENALDQQQQPDAEWEAFKEKVLSERGVQVPDAPPVGNPQPKDGKSFSGAGVLAVSVIDDNVKAYVNNTQQLTSEDISVLSNNQTILASLALTSAKSSGSRNNKALSGAVSYNGIEGDTLAYIEGPIQLNVAGALRVEAEQAGYIGSITAGIGKAQSESGSSGTGNSSAMAGSISVNQIDHNVDAHIFDATITVVGDTSVKATEKSLIVCIAGSSGESTSQRTTTKTGPGSKGVGVALAINLIGLKSSPVTTLAYVEDSTLNMAGGTLDIIASNAQPGSAPRIYALAQSYGGTDGMQGKAISGTIGVNSISNETRAYLLDSDVNDTSSGSSGVSLNVFAFDTSGIVAYSGGWAKSKKGSGFGAAIGYNEVRGLTAAYIDKTTVDVRGSINVKAENLSVIGAGVLGVASGKGVDGWGVAGSSSIAIIVNTTDAHISDSQISSSGAVSVLANDKSYLVSASGGFAKGGSVAVGATIDYHRISSTVLAHIDDSTVHALSGDVKVIATSKPLLIGIGLAASSGKSTAIGGALVINSIANTVQGYVRNSTVTADLGDVIVNAYESAVLYSAALGAAQSSSGNGVGVSMAYNYIGGNFDVGADPNVIKANDGVDGMKSVEADGVDTTSSIAAFIKNSQVTATIGRISVLSGFKDPSSDDDLGPLVERTETFNPANAVVLGGNTLSIPNHGYQLGDRVVYEKSTGVNAIHGLQENREYFVIVVDANTIQLATSPLNVEHRIPVELTSQGASSTHQLTKLDTATALRFAPSVITVLGDKVSYGKEHGLADRQRVIYTSGGSENIPGLVDGQAYWIIKIDDQTVQLASSLTNAISRTALAISNASGDQHALVPFHTSGQSFASSAVKIHAALGNTIGFEEAHGFKTGDAIIYRKGAESAVALGGLQDGETYYVIKVDDTHIRLAESQVDVQAETPIAVVITSSGLGGSHLLLVKRRSVDVGGEIIDLPEPISGQMVTVTIAGALGNGASGAGAISLNYVRADVLSQVETTAMQSVPSSAGNRKLLASGDVVVAAKDVSRIYTGTGQLTKGGNAAGAAIGVADIKNSVRSSIDGATVESTAGDVEVLAHEDARIIDVVAGIVISSGTFNFAGSVGVNKIRNVVDAHIGATDYGPASVTADQSVFVDAKDTSTIASYVGAIAAGGKATIGAAIAVNKVSDTILAQIDSSKVVAKNGDILVDASFEEPTTLPPGLDSQIAALTLSGSVGSGISAAGSFSFNWIRNTVDAKISNIGDLNTDSTKYSGAEIYAGGTIGVTASDKSTSNSLAGGFSIGADVGAGASVSYTYLGGDPGDPTVNDGNHVRALMENISGKVIADKIDVHADFNASIHDITVAGGVGGYFSLGAAVSINRIRMKTEAAITGSGEIVVGAGGVNVQAVSQPTIVADAGGFALALGKQAGAALGITYSRNEIDINTYAIIDGVQLTSSGDIIVTATKNDLIKSFALAAAISATSSASGAASGAVTKNIINSNTEAEIRNSRKPWSSSPKGIKSTAGSVKVKAVDTSEIRARAIGASIAIASGSSAATMSIAVSSARNEINSNANAAITNADVNSYGSTTVIAGDTDGLFSRKIDAVSVAASVSLALGASQSISLSGAGAEAMNNIQGNTTAIFDNSSLTSGLDAVLDATDKSAVTATVVAASIGMASIGASVSKNSIGYDKDEKRTGNDIKAGSRNTSIGANGKFSATATSEADIEATVIAASVGISKSTGVALSLSGAGASSENRIANDVSTYLDGDAQTSNPLSKGITASSVQLEAEDTSTITSHAGAASLALAFSGASATVTIGIGLARNVIDNDVTSYIQNVNQDDLVTTNSSTGDVDVTANSSSTITSIAWAATLGFSGGGTAGLAISGAGADAHNVIVGDTKAYVIDSRLSVAKDLNVTATQQDTITSNVVGASVAGSVGASGGAALSIGVSLAHSYIGMSEDGKTANTSEVQAYVRNSELQVAEDMVLNASFTPYVKSEVLAISVAMAAGQGSLAGAGAGSTADNIINTKVNAFIDGDQQGSSFVPSGSITADSISITATDTSTNVASAKAAIISASAGAISGSISVGAGLASNLIQNDVSAYISRIDRA